MIDFDHNASTPLDARVRQAMLGALEAANPSSTHARGRAARALLDAARRQVADLLDAEPGEVVFTASGSEANALALTGTFLARRRESPRLLLCAVEHPSLLETARHCEALGAEVVRLPVDDQGVLRLEALERELARGAALVCVMRANNETGAVQPSAGALALARAAGVPLLCDAVQAAGKLALEPARALGDLLSLSAHKLGGPPGAGALFVRRGLPLPPLVGGHQERGRRGGTENVAFAVGLARALELALASQPETERYLRALRDRFERALAKALPGARVNASRARRLCNTSSIVFPGADGEALLIALDLQGVCCSLGAACASGALSPSHVLLAMGLSEAEARGALRFSLGLQNTEAEADRVVALLAAQVPRARQAAG